MTLQEIKLLFAYNAWANDRVFEALASVPEEDYRKDLKGSHGGIEGTLRHLVGAEKIWLSRWVGQPETTFLQPSDVPTLAAMKALWERIAHETVAFVGKMNDKKLQQVVTITNLEGKKFSHSYQQMFQHIVNHSTYHRGQITTLMRQVGAKPVDTDLIIFYRQTRGAQPQK